ncbi:hypothetical protein LCGC14_1223900, partial [marine sediment metagenome]
VVDQFKMDAQGAVANSGTAGAITFETTNGGMVFIIDGAANGDVLFDVESSWFLKVPDGLDDVFRIYSSAGPVLMDLDLNVTDTFTIGDAANEVGVGTVGCALLFQGSVGSVANGAATDASAGGAATWRGGTGGAAFTIGAQDDNAAAGGATNVLGGTGGATTAGAGDAGTAGAGGILTARGGTGGASLNDTVNGGAGGASNFAGGTGGVGNTGTTGGVGGALNITGGTAGAAGGGTGGNGGVVNIDGGTGVTAGNVTIDAGVGSTTDGNVVIAGTTGLVNSIGNVGGTLALDSSDWGITATGVVDALASIAFDANSSPTITVVGNGADTFTISQTGAGADDHLVIEGQGNSADALTLSTTTNAGGILISSVGGIEYTSTAAFQSYTTNSKQHKKIYIPLSMGLTQATDIMVAAPGSPLQCTGLDAGAAETGAAEGYVAVGDGADILIFEFQLPDDFIDTGTEADLILTFDIAEQAVANVDIDVRIFDYNNGTHTTPIITDTIISLNGAGRTEEALETNAAGIGDEAEIDVEDVLVIEITANGDADDFNIYGIWITYRTGVECSQ